MLSWLVVGSSLLGSTFIFSSKYVFVEGIDCSIKDYIGPVVNAMVTCADKSYEAKSDVYLASSDHIGLQDCLNESDKKTCDDLISEYNNAVSTQSLTMKQLTSALMKDPNSVCSCVDKNVMDQNHCILAIDELELYCLTFYSPATSLDKVAFIKSAQDSLDPVSYHDDDVSECYDYLTQNCPYEDTFGYEQSIGCVVMNSNDLGDICQPVLQAVLASARLVCQNDLSDYCGDNLESPMKTIGCLKNSDDVSRVCQKYLSDLVLGSNVPCQFEVDYYCGDFDDIEDVLMCLEAIDPGKVSFSCSPMVRGYEVCTAEALDTSLSGDKSPTNPVYNDDDSVEKIPIDDDDDVDDDDIDDIGNDGVSVEADDDDAESLPIGDDEDDEESRGEDDEGDDLGLDEGDDETPADSGIRYSLKQRLLRNSRGSLKRRRTSSSNLWDIATKDADRPCWARNTYNGRLFHDSYDERGSPSLLMIAVVSVASVMFASILVAALKRYMGWGTDKRGRYKPFASDESEAVDDPVEEEDKELDAEGAPASNAVAMKAINRNDFTKLPQ